MINTIKHGLWTFDYDTKKIIGVIQTKEMFADMVSLNEINIKKFP